MIASGDVLLEVELLDRLGVRSVWQAAERARKRERYVPRILALAERAPLDHLRALEDLRKVARTIELRECIHVEELRAGRSNEWCMGRSCDMGDLVEQLHVLRMTTELVIADQRAEWRAAECAVLLFVDLLEERALIELGCLLEIIEKLRLRNRKYTQLQPCAGLGVRHQIVQATPCRLQLLELGLVHDLVELTAEHLVDLGDTTIDHRRSVLAGGHPLVDKLGHEFTDQITCMGALVLVTRHLPIFDDPVEKAEFTRFLDRRHVRGGCGLSFLRHYHYLL